MLTFIKLFPVIHPHFRATLALAALLGVSSSAMAEDKSAPAAAVVAPALEAKFIATLTNATLAGRSATIKGEQLGPEEEETYHIVGVTKNSGDQWTISARLTFRGESVVVPIPARVQWAGDAPVLIVDQISLGAGPRYSARVMIYEKSYAGTWSGGDHGGMLYGLITNAAN